MYVISSEIVITILSTSVKVNIAFCHLHIWHTYLYEKIKDDNKICKFKFFGNDSGCRFNEGVGNQYIVGSLSWWSLTFSENLMGKLVHGHL